jgi:hypothetical protein
LERARATIFNHERNGKAVRTRGGEEVMGERAKPANDG